MKAHCILAAALVAFASAAGAQTLKPGLWEVTHKMSGANSQMDQQMAQMQKQMAAMPPAQRKQMEEMHGQAGHADARRGAPGGGMSVRMCLTKEMAERSDDPGAAGRLQDDAPVAHRQHHEGGVRLHPARPPPARASTPSPAPQAYSMKMAVSTTVQGKPQKMNMEGSGKWLGADCGKVKPMAPPKK